VGVGLPQPALFWFAVVHGLADGLHLEGVHRVALQQPVVAGGPRFHLFFTGRSHRLAVSFILGSRAVAANREVRQHPAEMLRADMSPKPVYEQLQRLIHEEWTTRTNGTTDAAGSFACRGFLGKYRLVIQMPDGKVEREVQLTQNGPPEIVVRLATSSAR
jgi:hypothetical protein